MKNQKGVTLVELIVTVGALASLAIGGVLLYVVFHFVAKFW